MLGDQVLPEVRLVQAHEVAAQGAVAVLGHVLLGLLREGLPVLVVRHHVRLHFVHARQVRAANLALGRVAREDVPPVAVFGLLAQHLDLGNVCLGNGLIVEVELAQLVDLAVVRLDNLLEGGRHAGVEIGLIGGGLSCGGLLIMISLLLHLVRYLLLNLLLVSAAGRSRNLRSATATTVVILILRAILVSDVAHILAHNNLLQNILFIFHLDARLVILNLLFCLLASHHWTLAAVGGVREI